MCWWTIEAIASSPTLGRARCGPRRTVSAASTFPVRHCFTLSSPLGTDIPADGTLRWQAPELMSGASDLTRQVDVYAFAITCVEILNKGALPWPAADDATVRHFVLGTLIPIVRLSFHSSLTHSDNCLPRRGQAPRATPPARLDAAAHRAPARVLAPRPGSAACVHADRPRCAAAPGALWIGGEGLARPRTPCGVRADAHAQVARHAPHPLASPPSCVLSPSVLYRRL